MGRQSFKTRTSSYNLSSNKNETAKKDSKLGRFCFTNDAFEPELKQFVLEGWNGKKQRSVNYRAGWHMDEHTIPVNDLILRYGYADLNTGLSEDLVEINRQKYGVNILLPPKKTPEIIKLMKNVLLGLNLLLWICGVITIAAAVAQFIINDADDAYGSLCSGISLIIVVLVAGCFAYYQEFQSGKIMDAFKKLVPQFVTVIRDGQRKQIDSTGIVVGDVIEISSGDKIPADIRIVESQGLKVDNSSITGESDPQKRSNLCTHKDPMESKNLAFFSTGAVEGKGKGIVIKVGSSTLIGRLASLASSVSSEQSPIAKEMTKIITVLTCISLVFGVIFYFIGLSMNYSLLSSLFFVVGIVVGNVPENLNVTLTIILALAAKKMAKKQCLVKSLHAVETLGSCSVICSDKTGTLTQNRMTCAHIWFNDATFEADTTEHMSNKKFKETYNTDTVGFLELAKVASLCSTAKFTDKPGEEDKPAIMRVAEGDSSEVAILKCMEIQFGNVERYREKFPKVFEIPFNSVNKFHISVHAINTSQEFSFFIAIKGAPEKILDMCKTILINNIDVELNEENRKRIKTAYLNLASLGERVLGFADCYLSSKKYQNTQIFNEENFEGLVEDLRFVGLISLIDPPRSAVPSAVLRCKSAGVKVAMITGDHPVTAKAIARAVNIISPENKTIEDICNEYGENMENIDEAKLNLVNAAVISGPEVEKMSTEQIQCFISMYDEIVFARTTPEQKYEIVKAYQKLGHIVAVTGDGVNDSPALKRADIGIAMGSGTDVAKEVANLILIDDNFATIVGGIEDGRLIFDNLKKLIRYTMADNVAEMYCYWVYIVLRVPLPMGTLGMLLSTLGADVFPAVSLAHESAESDIMKLKPRNPNTDTLMSMPMLSYSYGQIAILEVAAGFYSYFVTFAIYGWLPKDLLYSQLKYESVTVNDLVDSFGQEWTYESRMQLEKMAQTAFFLALVVCQFFNAICCKTRRISIFQKGMKNNLMNVGLIMMILVPCIFIYTPMLNTVVSFVPLGMESWISTLPFGLLLFVYDELRRLAVRKGNSVWISKEFTS